MPTTSLHAGQVTEPSAEAASALQHPKKKKKTRVALQEQLATRGIQPVANGKTGTRGQNVRARGPQPRTAQHCCGQGLASRHGQGKVSPVATSEKPHEPSLCVQRLGSSPLSQLRILFGTVPARGRHTDTAIPARCSRFSPTVLPVSYKGETPRVLRVIPPAFFLPELEEEEAALPAYLRAARRWVLPTAS